MKINVNAGRSSKLLIKLGSCLEWSRLNHWISLCSKRPPYALTYARRCICHCLAASCHIALIKSQWCHVIADITW